MAASVATTRIAIGFCAGELRPIRDRGAGSVARGGSWSDGRDDLIVFGYEIKFL
jgi:hypothetical protein